MTSPSEDGGEQHFAWSSTATGGYDEHTTSTEYGSDSHGGLDGPPTGWTWTIPSTPDSATGPVPPLPVPPLPDDDAPSSEDPPPDTELDFDDFSSGDDGGMTAYA